MCDSENATQSQNVDENNSQEPQANPSYDVTIRDDNSGQSPNAMENPVTSQSGSISPTTPQRQAKRDKKSSVPAIFVSRERDDSRPLKASSSTKKSSRGSTSSTPKRSPVRKHPARTGNNRRRITKKEDTSTSTTESTTTTNSTDGLGEEIEKNEDYNSEEEQIRNNVFEDSVSAFFSNDDYDNDQAALLAAQMGQNTFGYMGALPVHSGRVPPERSRIIQEILRDFDLEKVMSRYRGRTMYSSYRDSLKDTHFRSSLEEIMGREKAPFDDQRWNDRLKEKVMADLERRLDDNERKLEEAETRRLLKLKLMGICNGYDWEEEEKKRHAQKPHKKTAAERKFEKRNKLARESVFRPSEDIESQMEILHRDESQVKRRSKGGTSNSGTNSGAASTSGNEENGDTVDSSYSPSVDDNKESPESADTGRSTGADTDKREFHHQLRKLFEEEDLQQLYKEAESLVRLTHTTKAHKK